MRKIIINEVFKYYNSGWAILIYDSETANIIQPLFSRSDMIKYHIMFTKHINEKSEVWDFPAIYFLKCNSENSIIINKEYKKKIYSDYRVCSISEPENLDKKINYKIFHTPINAIEERIYLLKAENLYGLQIALKSNIRIKYLQGIKEMAYEFDKKLKKLEEKEIIKKYENDITILLINREIDLITPLIHFFTFRSAIKELNYDVDSKDILYPELCNNHISEVQEILKLHATNLNKTLEKVKKSKEIDLIELSKLLIEAPKNVKIKEGIEKYSKIMRDLFDNVNNLKKLIEAEQILTTEYDMFGQKIKKTVDYYLKILENNMFKKDDRIRFLYLLKIKGINFTKEEEESLKNIGFNEEDISLKINTVNQIFKNKFQKSKYKISRYIPILNDILKKYFNGNNIFETIGNIPKKKYSLRKSFMLTSKNNITKPIVIIYILGGITEEECALIYSLSHLLGLEILCGSDKILTPNSFIKYLKENCKK